MEPIITYTLGFVFFELGWIVGEYVGEYIVDKIMV
jgi:hypothetical protein